VHLTDQIDRRSELSREQFEREYLYPLKPVIVTDGIAHWGALGKWSPQFFKTTYGSIVVEVDGESMTLAELIDRVEASTADEPAPYLRNQALADWPAELSADVFPMPDCTRPNWLESRFFPSGRSLSSPEVYIGGHGAHFPVLHYDGLHTHAFLMQLYGDKEYIALAPDQAQFLYPRVGLDSNKSRIDNVLAPDLERFPLLEQAEGVRFQLHPGETLFVPSGWWHTARILNPSVTVSINGVNRSNAGAFRTDYGAIIAENSRAKSMVAKAGLRVAGATRLFERT
jgi:hypothetical protein